MWRLVAHASYRFELAGTVGGVPVGYDGSVLEISIDGGEFQDVEAAGGTFTEGGYNGYVLAIESNDPNLPYGPRGFVDENEDFFAPATISFGTSLAGHSVRFRFRMVTDIAVGDFGWFIDNFRFTGVTTPPFSNQVPEGSADNANRPPHVSVPASFSTPERATGSTTQATVTLAASAVDLDGVDTLTYTWTQTAGPAVTLTGASTTTASFVAPNIAADTMLSFDFTASDGVASDSGSVTVTLTNVNSPGSVVITGPVQQSVGKTATFTSTASDPDGAVTYAWTVTGPSSVAVAGASTATASFAPEKAGTYTVTLTVTDPEGATTSATTPYEVTQPIKGGGSFDWLLALGGLAAFGARRRRNRHA